MKHTHLCYLPSILQFSELLLFREEFRDICECVNECVGLESADRRLFGASGLGVTVTKGCIEPKEIHFSVIHGNFYVEDLLRNSGRDKVQIYCFLFLN